MARLKLADAVRNRKAQIAAGAAGVAAMQPEDSEAIILRAATPTVKAAPSYAYKATPENLERALDMFDEGVSPRDIYNETGFFKGADGILRFEVSDKGTRYIVESDEQRAMSERGRGRLLSEATERPSDAMFVGVPGGNFDPLVRELDLSGSGSAGYATGEEIVIDRNYAQPEKFREFTPESIMLHEQQHILQGKMGMNQGGNQSSKRRALEQLPGPTAKQEAAEARRMDLLRNSRGLGPLETVIKYRGYAKEGMSPDSNLTGKRRLLVGNSYWYEFGDDIRRELGPEPKRHRPKREREDWLREAWTLLANKIETRAGPEAKLNALRLIKPNLFDDPEMTFAKLADKYDELVLDGEIQRKDLVNALKRVETQLRKVEGDAQEYRDMVYRREELRDLPPSEFYRRLGGEVEARNVQTRMDMSQDELYASYPMDTEDVPRDRQILRDAPLQKATLGAVAGGIGITGANEAEASAMPVISSTGPKGKRIVGQTRTHDLTNYGSGSIPKGAVSDIPTMEGVEQRAQMFASNRDNKNRAWTGLKDAVGKMTQPFQPLAEFIAHSAAGMGSGLVGFAGHGGGGDLQKDFGTPYSPQAVEDMRALIRGIPEQIGFGPMEDNSYQRALNDAVGAVADAVTSNPGYRAFVEPMLPDAAEFLIDQYQQEPPHYQDALGGLGEYIGNVIR